MLARDIRRCPPGHAHYTTWLDERGSSWRTASSSTRHRTSSSDFLAEPNFAWFADRVGRLDVTVEEEVSLDIGTLAVQGPRSRDLLARLVPARRSRPSSGSRPGTIAGRPVTVSRTGYTGDLGYETGSRRRTPPRCGMPSGDAADGHGVLPYGMGALYMLRIEAGLLLLKDFDSSRFAFNDAHRSTPLELGWAWMFKGLEDDDDRPFYRRRALSASGARRARWRMVGLVVDWQDYDRAHRGRPDPPKDHGRCTRTGWCMTPIGPASATRPASCTRRCCSNTSRWRACGSTWPSPALKRLRVHGGPPLRAGGGARRAPALYSPERKTA